MLEIVLTGAMVLAYAILISILLSLGLLFLGLMVGLAWGDREQKRQVAELAAQECPHCHTAFGPEAVLQARQAYQVQCEEIRRQHPGSKINFAKEWAITCPQCQRESYFDYSEHQLHLFSMKERCQERRKQQEILDRRNAEAREFFKVEAK